MAEWVGGSRPTSSSIVLSGSAHIAPTALITPTWPQSALEHLWPHLQHNIHNRTCVNCTMEIPIPSDNIYSVYYMNSTTNDIITTARLVWIFTTSHHNNQWYQGSVCVCVCVCVWGVCACHHTVDGNTYSQLMLKMRCGTQDQVHGTPVHSSLNFDPLCVRTVGGSISHVICACKNVQTYKQRVFHTVQCVVASWKVECVAQAAPLLCC